MSELRVRRLDAAARLPTRAYPGDAGLDLYALESAALGPGDRASIRTGISQPPIGARAPTRQASGYLMAGASRPCRSLRPSLWQD